MLRSDALVLHSCSYLLPSRQNPGVCDLSGSLTPFVPGCRAALDCWDWGPCLLAAKSAIPSLCPHSWQISAQGMHFWSQAGWRDGIRWYNIIEVFITFSFNITN